MMFESLEPHSPEWLIERTAAYVADAKKIVETLEKYEQVHPPHDEGVPCLEMALHHARKALERATEKNPGG